MLFFVGYIVSTTVVWLVGVLVNAAIIWIYTKKNSRVNKSGQREFPLMFAVIDLIAITITLPTNIAFVCLKYKNGSYSIIHAEFLNISFNFVLFGYILCLLTATVDKFYAVYFPFKYRLVHKKIIKITIGLVFGFSATIYAIRQTVQVLKDVHFMAFIGLMAAYSVINSLVFVTVVVLHVLLVVKLIETGRKIGRVEQKPTAKLVYVLIKNA